MKEYSFLNTLVLVNGVPITGWAEGDDVIGVEFNSPPASHKIGAGGDMVVSTSADRSGKITFKLQRTSPSNLYLQALYEERRLSPGKADPLQILCQDTARMDRVNGSGGYFSAAPKMGFGATAPDQEWEITVERLDLAFGL